MKQEAFFISTMPPSIQDVKIYFTQKGGPDREAEHFFLFYEKKRWKKQKRQFFERLEKYCSELDYVGFKRRTLAIQ